MSGPVIHHSDLTEICYIILYFVFHFIGMCGPHLASCKRQIAQRESTGKDREHKNTGRNVPEIGII